MSQVISVILAAGKGTRMKSKMPKVLHRVCGEPMLAHVVRAAAEAGVDQNFIVIGHEAEMVKEAMGQSVEYVLQLEQLGTGHAVMQAEPLLQDFKGSIIVLCGDTPLITPETISKIIQNHLNSGYAGTVLTAEMDDPTGYGRVIRDKAGQVMEIVEHKDASPDQLAIMEVNTGVYCFSGPKLFSGLKEVTPSNAQGEYYLTDVLAILKQKGEKVGAVKVGDPLETMGINNRVQLAEAESILRKKILDKLMLDGVTIIDPLNTYIGPEVTIGFDSVIHPGTIIEGRCRLGEACEVGPYTRLKDTELGKGVTVQNSIVLESLIGDKCTIGPFAYIRPGTILKEAVKVGDFVEIKKSIVGNGSKVPHLSYIGDSEIGEKVNIGAGTITCNYDGLKKSKTIIDDGAFIGSNSNLVAPVSVGKDSVIGAGSTVTRDIPEGSLCVERSKQEIYNDWVARKKKKK